MKKDTERILIIGLLCILCFSFLFSTLVLPLVPQCVFCPGSAAGYNWSGFFLSFVFTLMFLFFLVRSRYSPWAFTEDDIWILKHIKTTPRRSELQKRYVKEKKKTERNFRKRMVKLVSMKVIKKDGHYLKILDDRMLR